MIKDGQGGGNTRTGLIFEGKNDLGTFLSTQEGYVVRDDIVYYRDEEVAKVFKKHGFYDILKSMDIDWKNIVSRQILPDDGIYVMSNKTMFIIEYKFQQTEGSVDEKLQTCDFKKKQYQKVLSSAKIEVNYIYVLSKWFEQQKYKDVLDYIISVGCDYYFESIPLEILGLPVPETTEGTDLCGKK